MAEYAAWVDRIYAQAKDARVKELEKIISAFSARSKTAYNLAEALSDLKEFEKPSFLTHLHEVPLKGGKPGTLEHWKFAGPVLAVKHKKLPLILAVAKDNKAFTGKKNESLDSIEKDFDIRQVLSWTNVVSRMTSKQKSKLASLLIDGIGTQKKTKKPEEVWLSDFIEGEKEFRVIGFAANAPYINVDRAFGDTKPIWVHPWGIPSLLLKHKTLPVIMMVSPAIRLNENLLGSRNMEGYTG